MKKRGQCDKCIVQQKDRIAQNHQPPGKDSGNRPQHEVIDVDERAIDVNETSGDPKH